MARGKFQTLTEQMFYILLCLRQERCGADVMAWVAEATGSRVAVGPGTLYNLLEQFLQAGYIRETKVEGRKRSYVLTPTGREALEAEARRLRQLIEGLPARERKLILLRYGLAGQPPLTQLETAKLLQISRSYVSRLETHALDQLRKGWLQESPGE